MVKNSIIDKIIKLDNLHWAWEKVKHFYNEDNFWCDELEISIFQATYEENLKIIRNKIKNGTYKLNPIKPIFFPKKEAENRQMFWISLEDQLVWLAVMNVIGKYYDRHMPYWSYGNRLYINMFPDKETSTEEKITWKYGAYLNTTKQTYRSFGQSWPRFRKDIYITSKVMTKTGKELQEQLTEEEQADITTTEKLSSEIHKVKYKTKEFWEIKHTNPDIYWCSLDLKKFYPNAKASVILDNFNKYGNDLKEKFDDFDTLLKLLKNLLNFTIDYDIGLNIETVDWKQIQLENKQKSFQAIPTGLFAAGFLSNIVMLDIDKQLNNIIEEKSKTDEKIALFRFVDDYTILSTSMSSSLDLIEDVEKLLNNQFNSTLKLNKDKTKPDELAKFLNSKSFNSELLKIAMEEMKLDSNFPTPLMNHTLKKISMSNRLSFELLDSDEEKKYIQDIEHLLVTDISEEEIREDTRLSFASSKLSILVPKKKYDYTEIYDIKCKIKDIQQVIFNLQEKWREKLQPFPNDEQLTIDKMHEEVENLEQKLIVVKNKLNDEIQKNRRQTSLLLEFAIVRYPDKLKLWKNLINFYKNIGLNETSDFVELLNIFKVLKNAKSSNQINIYTHEYLITYIVNVLTNSIISTTKKLQLENISERERNIKQSFLNGLLNEKVLNTLNSYSNHYSSFYFMQSWELLNLSLSVCRFYYKNNKLELQSFNNFSNDMKLQYYCWMIEKFDLELSKPFIEDFLKTTALQNNIVSYIVSLYPSLKFNQFYNVLLEKSNSYFPFSWWYNYYIYNGVPLDTSIIYNINAKKALAILNANDEINIFEFIYNLKNIYSEETSLLIIKSIIEEYLTISGSGFSTISHDENVLQQFPYNIYIDKNKKVIIKNIKNIKISDKRYLPDFIDFNKQMGANKEKQFIHGIGILLYQLISRDLYMPEKFYQPSSQLINSNYFIGRISQYHISSFSYEIIKACLSKRNRELESLSSENFGNNDFDEDQNSINIGSVDILVEYIKKSIQFLSKNKSENGEKTRFLIPKKLFSLTRNFDNNITKVKNISLKIGYIQINFDNMAAWGPSNNITLSIKSEVEEYIWQEVLKGFHKMNNHHTKPDIIVIPELTIPNPYIRSLEKLAAEINCVIFAGLDWQKDFINQHIKNNAIMIVPNNWNTNLKSFSSNTTFLGKKYPANLEKSSIEDYNNTNKTCFEFISDDNMYLIDAKEFGKIGFAICADFYDIERFMIYKGRVQHIIILALNQDTNSFFAISEAVARLVMCNVVICNTGFFGDSLAFSPYKTDFKRMIYRNQGAKLFATQVVELPVKSLIDDQKQGSDIKNIKKIKNFKMPPEYKYDSN